MSPTYAASQTKLWGSLALAQISKLAAATRQNRVSCGLIPHALGME
jgi:N-terminal acetyltransferase B complex non-catalytic subunit